MHDWRDGLVRYLVHFDDGGSGMRMRAARLEPRCELDDGGGRYQVVRVEQSARRAAASCAIVELFRGTAVRFDG